MSNYMTILGNNLRNLRLTCGYTQGSIAAALGVARPTYSYYEIGRTNPDAETLVKLTRMYGVSLEQLMVPGEMPDITPSGQRARHRPTVDPQTIGDLTEEEKVLIARLRSGELPKKEESP